MRSNSAVFALMLTVSLTIGEAAAQVRPLRLIVPYPPGPGVDLIARTPTAVMARIQTSVAGALADSSVRDRLSADGAEIVANRPDAALRFLQTEIRRWGAVVKMAGLNVD